VSGAKTVCSRHDVAHLVGELCPYCEPESPREAMARMGIPTRAELAATPSEFGVAGTLTRCGDGTWSVSSSWLPTAQAPKPCGDQPPSIAAVMREMDEQCSQLEAALCGFGTPPREPYEGLRAWLPSGVSRPFFGAVGRIPPVVVDYDD
jgi:hypothetical protein